jgi:hypothetical protein
VGQNKVRRIYESSPTTCGFAVTFSLEQDGIAAEKYGALFGKQEDFDSAVRDWTAGMEELQFCSKHSAQRFNHS